jgi:ribosomal protein S17
MDEVINNQEAPAGEVAVVTETAVKSAGRARHSRRVEKVGIVTSDKMMKTMAHNEIEGVSTGDQVRIVETRPLSAHKRWRVVEVLRKASK